jgi:hypothetical protein
MQESENKQTEASQIEKNNQVKAALLQSLNSTGAQLFDFMHKLPGHPVLKNNCFLNLDQALYWARQAIVSMELDRPEEAQAPEAGKAEVSKTEVSKAENCQAEAQA